MANLKPAYVDLSSGELVEPRNNDKLINDPDVTVDSITELQESNISKSIYVRTKTLKLLGYNEPGDNGGGTVYWDADRDKQDHDGGTIFSTTWDNGTFGDPSDPNWHSPDPTDTGTGCWVRSYSGRVNAQWYGLRGDGVSNDTNGFEALITNHNNIFLPNGHYILESGLTETKEYFSIKGESKEAFLDFSQTDVNGNVFALAIEGETDQISGLDGQVSKDDTSVVFSSAHGFSEDDMFFIHNADDGSFNPSRTVYRDGEICIVKDVPDSTTVNLISPILSNYNPSSATIEVYKCTPATVEFSNFSYKPRDDARGFQCSNTRDTSISDINIKGGGFNRILIQNSYNARLENVTTQQGYNAPSNNYAIYFDGCQNSEIVDSFIEGSTSIDMGGASSNGPLVCNRNNIVDSCILVGRCTSHGNQENTQYSNNIIIGNAFLRGGRSIFTDNNLIGPLALGELVSFDHRIKNNNIELFETVSGANNVAFNTSDADSGIFREDSLFVFSENEIITNGYSNAFRSSILNQDDQSHIVNVRIKNNDMEGRVQIHPCFIKKLTLHNNNIDGDLRSDDVFCYIADIKDNLTEGRVNLTFSNAGDLISENKQRINYINNNSIIENSDRPSHVIDINAPSVLNEIDTEITIKGGEFQVGPNLIFSSASNNTCLLINGFDDMYMADVSLTSADSSPGNGLSLVGITNEYIKNVSLDPNSIRRDTVTNSFSGRGDLSNAGDPNGNISPEYIGRMCLDTTNDIWYKSIGFTNTDWVALNS